MLGGRPELVYCVAAVPPNFVNGPDGDVELNIWYAVAPVDAVHFIVIELDEIAFAVIPVGVAGGRGFVVADTGGLDSTDQPPVFPALTS